MATWPASLPQQPLQDSYSEVFEGGVIRTQVSAGPDITRRRTSANVRPLGPIEFVMSETQVSTFDDFYHDDLKNGALSFDFINTRTGNTVSFRFTSPPQLTAISHETYRVVVQLEQLP